MLLVHIARLKKGSLYALLCHGAAMKIDMKIEEQNLYRKILRVFSVYLCNCDSCSSYGGLVLFQRHLRVGRGEICARRFFESLLSLPCAVYSMRVCAVLSCEPVVAAESLGSLPTGFVHFVFFRQSFFGNILVPTRGTPKFGCKGLCQQGIDKIRFLVFGFRLTLTRTISSTALDCRLTTTVRTILLLLVELVV
jgi:hypothetical protein